MSSSTKMRRLSVRIDADLKASFEGTLRGIGVDPICAMRSFAFQIVLEGDIPFDPVDTGFEAGGGTAVTSAKIPEDVAGEMESVLKGLGTNFSQAVRLLALQTTRWEGCRSPPASPGRRDEGQTASRMALGAFSRQGALPASAPRGGQGAGADVTQASLLPKRKQNYA